MKPVLSTRSRDRARRAVAAVSCDTAEAVAELAQLAVTACAASQEGGSGCAMQPARSCSLPHSAAGLRAAAGAVAQAQPDHFPLAPKPQPAKGLKKKESCPPWAPGPARVVVVAPAPAPAALLLGSRPPAALL